MSQAKIDYKAVLADLEAKRRQLDTAIAAIRAMMLGEHVKPGDFDISKPENHAAEVKADSFFGMSVTDAAEKYLRMMKGTRTMKAITAALKDGGFTTTSKNFYSTVYTALSRDDRFAKVKKGEWGLAEWYPGRKAQQRKAGENNDDTNENQESEPNSSSGES